MTSVRSRLLGSINSIRFTGYRQTISSISKRSLQIEYSICNNCARSSCSGGIDGLSTFAYIASNRRDSCLSTSSTMARIPINSVIGIVNDKGGYHCQGMRARTARLLVRWGKRCTKLDMSSALCPNDPKPSGSVRKNISFADFLKSSAAEPRRV